MIRKLKQRFLLLSMSALLALMVFLVAGMNLINYLAVVREADEILFYLADNKGAFPIFHEDRAPEGEEPPALPEGAEGQKNFRGMPGMNRELQYESRYFSVLLDSSGAVVQTDTSRIASVTRAEALEMAQGIFKSGKKAGFSGAFRYYVSGEGENTRVSFLECTRKLQSFRTFLLASVLMAAVGLILAFIILLILSGRILRPIAESYEKQKRFITDAGHEIRTPLTIINANVDVLELEGEENESLTEIRRQTKRLAALTDDLVLLSRMEEQPAAAVRVDFPLSEIAAEAAASFKAPAEAHGRTFTAEIEPMLTLKGDSAAVTKLFSIFLENAVKYTPENAAIAFSLAKTGKNAVVTVRNDTAEPQDPEELAHVFDRFYRTDRSRNSQTGGHGIGLSIAKAIVTAHGGKIAAAAPEPCVFQISATFPL